MKLHVTVVLCYVALSTVNALASGLDVKPINEADYDIGQFVLIQPVPILGAEAFQNPQNSSTGILRKSRLRATLTAASGTSRLIGLGITSP